MIWSAFILGLLGSFHCIGMCGPIALMLPIGKSTPLQKGVKISLYNLGRITSYAIIGLVFGLLGEGLMTFGVQQQILLVTEPGKEEESIIRLARVGYDHAIGYLKGGFETWKKANREVDTVNRLAVDEFLTTFNKGEIQVFDVRKKSEFDSQHLKGAENTPLNQINDFLASFPKDQKFALHCAGGYRSMIAASILKQRGWDNFVDVRGGFDEIKEHENAQVTEYVCPTTLL